MFQLQLSLRRLFIVDLWLTGKERIMPGIAAMMPKRASDFHLFFKFWNKIFIEHRMFPLMKKYCVNCAILAKIRSVWNIADFNENSRICTSILNPPYLSTFQLIFFKSHLIGIYIVRRFENTSVSSIFLSIE